MSTEEDESDGRGTADDSVNSEGETTPDDPVDAEDETPPDDPVDAEDETPPDDPVDAEEQATADDPVNAEEETPANDPVSGHWLYIGLGLLTAVVAWLLIPLFGIGPIYAGYKLYDSEERPISAGIFVLLGALPLVFWVVFLVQAL